MSKSRSFSIFLLKSDFNSENALKENHLLGSPVEANSLPDGSVVYLSDSAPYSPWWREYCGISKEFTQVLKGAIVFISVKKRFFAITFGHTYHYLKENSYEYDFGIKVTLNSLDPNKLKSTDILSPDNAKRQRIQSPIESDLTFFDIDRDSSIMKRLTGKVKEDYKEIFTNATGASNLRISSKVSSGELTKLLEKLFRLYSSDDYKETFPEIKNITPVNDPIIIEQLNKKLIKAFENEEDELVMTIPDIIDYNDDLNVYFSGAGINNNIYQDIYIEYYRSYLNDRSISNIEVSDLQKHKLNLCNDDGKSYKQFSVFKCLLFDCEMDGLNYHFCEGNWYQIEAEYISKLNEFLDHHFFNNHLLLDYNHESEAKYNQAIADGSNFICLDKTNISPAGQYQVEPCDLYFVEEQIGKLYHVKISTRSSSLSHLFNQGVNSVELIRLEKESKDKLKKLVGNSLSEHDKNDFLSPIDNESLEVIYVIITRKDVNKKSLNLPIFSRISLKRCLKSLKVMGINSRVCFVKDLSEKKEIKQKRRKK